MSDALFCDFCPASGRARKVRTFSPLRPSPAASGAPSSLSSESWIVITPEARSKLPKSALPSGVGVLAFDGGTLPSSGKGGPKSPYTKLGVPDASVFIATKRRSLPSAARDLRFQRMYHWLLGGTTPLDGVSCSVSVTWFVFGPANGSATDSPRMLTLGSGGVFWPESLSEPSGFRSLTASTPGA